MTFLKNMLLILLCAFVIAKLFGVIAWSWWLVFLPAFIYLGMMAIVFLIVGILTAIAVWLSDK